MMRRAVPIQIGGARDHRRRDGRDRPREQARIVETGNAEREVETLRDQIVPRIAERQFDLDRRMPLHERRERDAEHLDPETRSEEHTSELQSTMRHPYADFT